MYADFSLLNAPWVLPVRRPLTAKTLSRLFFTTGLPNHIIMSHPKYRAVPRIHVFFARFDGLREDSLLWRVPIGPVQCACSSQYSSCSNKHVLRQHVLRPFWAEHYTLF